MSAPTSIIEMRCADDWIFSLALREAACRHAFRGIPCSSHCASRASPVQIHQDDTFHHRLVPVPEDMYPPASIQSNPREACHLCRNRFRFIEILLDTPGQARSPMDYLLSYPEQRCHSLHPKHVNQPRSLSQSTFKFVSFFFPNKGNAACHTKHLNAFIQELDSMSHGNHGVQCRNNTHAPAN